MNGPDMRKLRVAIVAPTLRILGGEAVQADRLLRGWRGDPDVDAWLVPINPLPPAGLRFAIEIKYLRTFVTESTYIPRLARALTFIRQRATEGIGVDDVARAAALIRPWSQEIAMQQAWENALGLGGQPGDAAGVKP